MTDFTGVKQRYVKRYLQLLHWVYSTNPGELDIDEEYEWVRGDKISAETLEEQKDALGFLYQEYGRRRVVANITTGLVSIVSEDDSLFVFMLTELCEIDLCIEENHILPAIMRGTSLLHQCFRSKLGSEDNFGSVIEDVSEEGIITDLQLRLVQFVRLVRNDAAHNFSYDTEYGFQVHDHAATCVVTLLVSLLESWFGFDWFDVELFVEPQLSVEQCIRVVEEEFGFEWDAEKEGYGRFSLVDEYDYREK